MPVILAKFENTTQLEKENNYVLKSLSAFIDNDPNLMMLPNTHK